MMRLLKSKRNVAATMASRLSLLEKPPEHFRRYCGGRIPTLAEKLFCVERAVQEITPTHVYYNDLYDVQVFHRLPFIHLHISRVDGLPCTNWEHFQQIKNEIVGPECEAAELFPAESRLINEGNEYHLWVHADPRFRFPVACGPRSVTAKIEFLLAQARRLSEASAEEDLRHEQVA